MNQPLPFRDSQVALQPRALASQSPPRIASQSWLNRDAPPGSRPRRGREFTSTACRLLALALLTWFAFAPALAADRPNVLVLFADDMRADTIAAHGNAFIDTPHIDSLVQRGYSFRRAYTLGSNNGAVCVPSRAMLMTGRPWAEIDAPNLKTELLLPEHLGRQGYTTFATGKWHNGPDSWQRAFQQGRQVMFGGMSDHTQVPLRSLVNGQLTPEQTGAGFSSELFADAAISFLEQQPADRPFFAYVAFTAPHDPRQAPEAYLEQYRRRPPPLPANFLPQHPFDNGQMRGGRDENLAAWPRDPRVIGDQLGEYYALVSHLDTQIGRILRTLRERGLEQNTWVIFAADNGLALGSHGLLGKQSVYEHSMRVPLVLAGPGIPQGASHDALVCLADLFPTLCHAVGAPVPPELKGVNLQHVWQGTTPRPREALVLPFLKFQRAVVESRYKLIVYPKIAHQQLFDLELDPHETRNRATEAAFAPILQRLHARLRDWQTQARDDLPLPDQYGPAPVINLSGQAREPDRWQPDWIIRKYFTPATAP